MGPFKCPDCGVWWAGFEHRCPDVYTAPNTNAPMWTSHCHGCMTAWCSCGNDRPCAWHQGGFARSGTQWDPDQKVWYTNTI